ncbi:MAG TPA: hypothetical protein VGA20_09570 [Gemmatimonadales bacterium]
MTRHSLALLGLLLAPVLGAQQTSPPPSNAAEVASIDAILAALYDVISGPAGQVRNWDRFRSLFAPGARLIPARSKPDGGAEALVLDVEGYIGRTSRFFEQNGFFEKELARTTEQFGTVAHAFSSYASYRTAQDSAPFSRGINSIQLLKDGNRWWVVSIFWDAERAGLTIPAEYLRPSKP